MRMPTRARAGGGGRSENEIGERGAAALGQALVGLTALRKLDLG